MPTAYVYSPFTGSISQGPGCNDNHVTCGSGSSPVDVAGLGDVYLYVNYPTVKYVNIQISSLCCNVSGANDDHKRSVRVDLYDASSCQFGFVLYGHIRSVGVGNGWITLTSSSLYIGKTVNVTHSVCYPGIHIHMQRSGGTTHVSCGANVTQGTSIIYSWSTVFC